MTNKRGNSPSDELAALKAKQHELAAEQEERMYLAERIAALEAQERERVQAETAAAKQAEYEAARAVLLDAELAAIPVLLNLQTRLHAVQEAASVTGGLFKHNRLAGIVRPIDDLVDMLKLTHPELLGLPSRQERLRAAELANLKRRIAWLEVKAKLPVPDDRRGDRDPFNYKAALKEARRRLAALDGRPGEADIDELELTDADLAFMRQTGINPAALRGKAARGA